MKRSEFDWLVKDALSSLYDWAALETHPLAQALPATLHDESSRAERMRQVLVEMIDRLKPAEGEPSAASRPWRPYLILTKRYVEGEDLQTLEDTLALSPRQLGREHSRALRAISSLMQAHLSQVVDEPDPGEDRRLEALLEDAADFETNLESLDVCEVVASVTDMLKKQAQSQDVTFHLRLDNRWPRLRVDRIILRQILLSLFGHALAMCADRQVVVSAETPTERINLAIRWLGQTPPAQLGKDGETSLRLANYWTERLGAELQIGADQIVLSWPRTGNPVVLVVDDQEPAIRLFQRYLSRTGLRVVGVRDPMRVVSLARELQPQAITLDVMLPTMDGWEVLQALSSDPDTCHIPVVICTIWDVRDVAASFSAAGFLQKPVTQRALMSALQKLGVTGISA